MNVILYITYGDNSGMDMVATGINCLDKAKELWRTNSKIARIEAVASQSPSEAWRTVWRERK